jgi:hypothetical protein
VARSVFKWHRPASPFAGFRRALGGQVWGSTSRITPKSIRVDQGPLALAKVTLESRHDGGPEQIVPMAHEQRGRRYIKFAAADAVRFFQERAD